MTRLVRAWRAWLWHRRDRRHPPRIFRLGRGELYGGWGDSIEWFVAGSKVVGWKDERPRKGDILLATDRSGKVGRFRFRRVDWKRDPEDMFFGDVEFEGYQQEACR